MSNLQKASERLREIRPDYAWNEDIFAEGDPRADVVRCIIEKRLTTVERTIILLYVDLQSYRKLGALLGFSQTTAYKEVRRIKEKILNIYGNT